MRFETSQTNSKGEPVRTTAANQRRIFNRFVETGRSGLHSEFGTTLAPLLNELVAKRIAFVLRYEPGGFTVEKEK